MAGTSTKQVVDKGLGKNPQKSELIHWRQCLLSGGTEACSLELRETLARIHVIPQMSQPRVVCWHGYRQNSQKTECVLRRRSAVENKIAGLNGLRSEQVKNKKMIGWKWLLSFMWIFENFHGKKNSITISWSLIKNWLHGLDILFISFFPWWLLLFFPEIFLKSGKILINHRPASNKFSDFSSQLNVSL